MDIECVIRPSGLYRCCIASVVQAMEVATAAPKEGDTLRCNYCKDGKMRFHNDAWGWDRD